MIFPKDPSVFVLGGRLIPGTVIAIGDAGRAWVWECKQGTASSMGTSVFKGAKLTEKFTVKVECVTEEEIAAIVDWRKYVAPARVTDKPTTFSVDNWLVSDWSGIDRCYITEIAQPDVTDTNSGVFVWTFGEYNPPAPAKTGKADAAAKALKGGATGKGGDSELEKLQAQAAALGKTATAVTT
ncbi:MAG: hypothetical protein WCJ30_11190 [Deltaproteobacteria bacterium]